MPMLIHIKYLYFIFKSTKVKLLKAKSKSIQFYNIIVVYIMYYILYFIKHN